MTPLSPEAERLRQQALMNIARLVAREAERQLGGKWVPRVAPDRRGEDRSDP